MMNHRRVWILLVVGAALGASADAVIRGSTDASSVDLPTLKVIGQSRSTVLAAWSGINYDDFRFAFRGPSGIEISFEPGEFEMTDWPPEAGRAGAVLFGQWNRRDYALKLRPLEEDFLVLFPHESRGVEPWAEKYVVHMRFLPLLPELLEILVEYRELLLVRASNAEAEAPVELQMLDSI